jgi:hypothetical protein
MDCQALGGIAWSCDCRLAGWISFARDLVDVLENVIKPLHGEQSQAEYRQP